MIGMPFYGRPTWEASKSVLLTPSRNQDLQVVAVKVANRSLLAYSFNELLCHALSLRDQGIATHFAMIHSDIAPENWWVDKLWTEMRTHNADLVSAVVPIKDHANYDQWRMNPNHFGRTSTAVGSIEDPWKTPQYITMEDRNHLPETFGQQDVCDDGQVLLVNTGLWLADLRRPWWNAFHFGILDRVTVDEKGHRTVDCRPEDWEMSRYLHAKGAKVMATWAVVLEHLGDGSWRNY